MLFSIYCCSTSLCLSLFLFRTMIRPAARFASSISMNIHTVFLFALLEFTLFFHPYQFDNGWWIRKNPDYARLRRQVRVRWYRRTTNKVSHRHRDEDHQHRSSRRRQRQHADMTVAKNTIRQIGNFSLSAMTTKQCSMKHHRTSSQIRRKISRRNAHIDITTIVHIINRSKRKNVRHLTNDIQPNEGKHRTVLRIRIRNEFPTEF